VLHLQVVDYVEDKESFSNSSLDEPSISRELQSRETPSRESPLGPGRLCQSSFIPVDDAHYSV
jgi:hypothetical protein